MFFVLRFYGGKTAPVAPLCGTRPVDAPEHLEFVAACPMKEARLFHHNHFSFWIVRLAASDDDNKLSKDLSCDLHFQVSKLHEVSTFWISTEV